jgi:hypothetical protein
MAVLLVKQQDNNVPDTPGKWRAGEIVNVFEDGHIFGLKEVPSAGSFYHVHVTDKTKAQVESYLQVWEHDPVVSVENNDGVGGFRLKITSTMVSTGGQNAVTRAQMDGFVTKWGGAYFAHDNSSYTFDITTFAAATSEGLWGPLAAQATFANSGFAAGVQTVEITSRPPELTDEKIIAAILKYGGGLVPPDSFTMPTAAIKDEFEHDMKEKWRDLGYRRRRWTINAAGLAFLAANGGTVTGTAAQVAGYINDGLTD